MQPIKVLIVDDEAEFTEIVTDRLCSWGFAATAASGDDEVLGAIRRTRPDVVVLSLRDPRGDGLETLRLIRDYDLDSAILLLLGKGMAKIGMEGMRLGALDCLPQPLELGLLINKIRQAYGSRHAPDSHLGVELALLLPWTLHLAMEEIVVCCSGVQVLATGVPVF